MHGAALDRESIRQLIESPGEGAAPLVEGFLNLDEQLQPNGIDISLGAVSGFASAGAMGRDNRDRQVSETVQISFDSDDWVTLAPGHYLVAFNEVVNIPLDLMALGLPRSSLLRSGVNLPTAVWDAGYRGRSQALLSVNNPAGYRVQKGARLLQLVFFHLAGPVQQGYAGRYQDEGK